jgi:hypothetical protein
MPLLPADRTFINDFYAAIAPIEKAYINAVLSYVAIKRGDKFEIAHARLLLNAIEFKPAPFHFESENIRAARLTFDELLVDFRSFVEQLLAGVVKTPQGNIHFSNNENGRYATSFVPLHPDGLRTQVRYNVLTLMAGQLERLPQPNIDWEIKASAVPFDGLQEIANELGLGLLRWQVATVEIVGFNVAAVHKNSIVLGQTAMLRVLLAKTLDPNQVTLGYRVYVPNTQANRGTVQGADLTWVEEEGLLNGTGTLPVADAAVVNCTVSYAGIAQAHQWIADPEHVQNPRRVLYETFDPKLANLTAAISNASLRGQDARQLEGSVASLVWMLGFSAVHLGGIPKLQDASDLIVAAPGGNLALIECTVGILKAHDKLALLHARADLVRRNLSASNNAHLRVLPVIVTTRTATEIAVDMETAEKLGIWVITRESLDEAINRTLVQPNADQTYGLAEQAVAAGIAKHQTQTALTLGDVGPPPFG